MYIIFLLGDTWRYNVHSIHIFAYLNLFKFLILKSIFKIIRLSEKLSNRLKFYTKTFFKKMLIERKIIGLYLYVNSNKLSNQKVEKACKSNSVNCSVLSLIVVLITIHFISKYISVRFKSPAILVIE